MVDRKSSDESKTGPDAREPSDAKPGGFGAFADRYRARWAADHPDMTRKWPAAGTAQVPTEAGAAGAEPNAGEPTASAASDVAGDAAPTTGLRPETP